MYCDTALRHSETSSTRHIVATQKSKTYFDILSVHNFLFRGIIPTTKSVKVKGSVRPVDGGLFVSGDEDSFIDAGDFSNECLSHPGKCQTGFSYSCKLKFNKVRIRDEVFL